MRVLTNVQDSLLIAADTTITNLLRKDRANELHNSKITIERDWYQKRSEKEHDELIAALKGQGRKGLVAGGLIGLLFGLWLSK